MAAFVAQFLLCSCFVEKTVPPRENAECRATANVASFNMLYFADKCLTLCRGGERVSRFACVDGPDFNGYEVDFEEAISRASLYRENERRSYDAACRLLRQTPGPAARG